MKPFRLVTLGLLFSSLLLAENSPETTKKTQAETLKKELSLSGGVFYAVGASNTHSYGLNFGLRERVLHHLSQYGNAKVIRSLRNDKKCVGFMLDRFFPTAFPVINDESVSDNDLQKEVDAIISAAVETGCFNVVVDLFHPSSLNASQAELVENNAPLKLLKKALQMADPAGKRTLVINERLADWAKKEPKKLLVLSFNEKITALTDPEKLDGKKFPELFQNNGNDIHGNYLGQGHFFNVYLREPMESFAGVKVTPIAFQSDYSPTWEKEVKTMASALSPQTEGAGKILNRTEFSNKKTQTYFEGSKHRGKMKRPGDLQAIDGVARKNVANPKVSIPIVKLREDGIEIYEINFTNLAYEKIKLYPTGDKTFVGVGTDYWGLSLGFDRISAKEKALTTYEFELTEVDQDRIDLVWKILPPLEIEAEVLPISANVREVTLDKKWATELKDHLEEYDRLEYSLQIQIDWPKK